MKTRWLASSVASLVVLCGVFAEAASLPAWDRVIRNGAARFRVLSQYDGAAVLGRETGLVWERHPASAVTDWSSALTICTGVVIGGRGAAGAPRPSGS